MCQSPSSRSTFLPTVRTLALIVRDWVNRINSIRNRKGRRESDALSFFNSHSNLAGFANLAGQRGLNALVDVSFLANLNNQSIEVRKIR